MKLYVCWNTVQVPRPPRGHPCHNAHKALRAAGHDPDVIKVRGLGIGPLKLLTGGRREVQELTGSPVVPVLVTEEGEAINGSQQIVEWAKSHPASSMPDGDNTSRDRGPRQPDRDHGDRDDHRVDPPGPAHG